MPAFSHAASALRRGAQLLGRRRGATLATTLALTAIALIALLAVLGQRQAKQLGAGWRGSAALVGYLRPEVPAERADEMTRAIAALPGVLRVELVGPDETARRLSEALGAQAALLADIEPGALPASIEIVVEAGGRDVLTSSPLFRDLAASDAVAEVEVVGEWSDRTGVLLAWTSRLADAGAELVVATLVLAGFLMLRLLLGQDSEEARVARLLGAPLGFLAAPRMLAGALVGLAAVGLAMLACGWLFDQVAADAARTWAVVFERPAPTFLPGAAWLVALGVGGLTGALAGLGAGPRPHG